jgi:hypothetical protein
MLADVFNAIFKKVQAKDSIPPGSGEAPGGKKT